jgi:predicted dehydrogenase
VRRYASADELLNDPAVEAVSICVPTPDHPDLAIAAIRGGKHVLVEKPLALTVDAAERVARAALERPDLVCLPAHCMRHWPGWDWLKARVADGTLGRVQAAFFQRMGPAPGWAQDFYRNPDRSGGAILDLHIHDADFVRFCFGAPASVQAVGLPTDRGSLDHITVTYRFENGPPMVVAEGAWVVAPGFPFVMRYRVHFDRAIATFELGADHPVTVYHADGRTEHPELAAGSGYTWQARHFLDRIERGDDALPIVTIEDGVEAVRLVELERATVTSRTGDGHA